MAAQCATDLDDNPLWQFAIATYAKPNVAAHLLRGQDELKLDVLWCLTALWLATQQRRLTSESKQQAAYDEWQRSMITPLRTLRYRCDKETDADLRRALLAAELAAEKRGIRLLYLGLTGNDDIAVVDQYDSEALLFDNLGALTGDDQWINELAKLLWQSNG